MDVVTAFLNPKIEGDNYMEIPEGYEDLQKPRPLRIDQTLACRLRKALYGLNQAPRLCYSLIHTFLTSPGFRRSSYYTNVYIHSGSVTSKRS